MMETWRDWTRCWLDGDGKRHRVGGPAFEGSDGTKCWYQHGKAHRVGGPAFEGSNGHRAWWLDDQFVGEERLQ